MNELLIFVTFADGPVLGILFFFNWVFLLSPTYNSRDYFSILSLCIQQTEAHCTESEIMKSTLLIPVQKVRLRGSASESTSVLGISHK